MRKILFVCSMGMSSAIAVKALKQEADKNLIDLEVKAIGATCLEEDLAENNYDMIMVAPQIKHRFMTLQPFADEKGIPIMMILPKGYGPLGGPFLLKQVKETLKFD